MSGYSYASDEVDDQYRTLYEAGRWTVAATPSGSWGCVVIAVVGDDRKIRARRSGYPQPRWWQRSVESALRWGIAVADKRHRDDEDARWAMEQAERAADAIQAQARALAALNEELAR